MVKLSFATLLLTALFLAACTDNDLRAKTPVLFAADRDGLPPARDGIWVGRACDPDPTFDMPAWDCFDAFIVRQGRPSDPPEYAGDGWSLIGAMRLGVAPDFQVAQTGPDDAGADGYYSFFGIDDVRLDSEGRMIALRNWRLKCGPPPPEGTKTLSGAPRRQTLDPYPGVVLENIGCAPKGRAGLIAAASAERADSGGEHGAADPYRWVREERPGDWPRARPGDDKSGKPSKPSP
jgi:hypothetical protein